jgi:hypothetical protein
MLYTKYDIASGHIIGRTDTGIPPTNSATIGYIEGYFDKSTYYIDELSAPQLKILHNTATVNKSKLTADNVDSIVISNLPIGGCWLRVGVSTVYVSGTTYSISTSVSETFTVSLIGKYFASNTLTIKALTPIESVSDIDPKWIALQDATSAQIDTWVNNNITTLLEARDLFKTVLKAIRVLHDRTKGN